MVVWEYDYEFWMLSASEYTIVIMRMTISEYTIIVSMRMTISEYECER